MQRLGGTFQRIRPWLGAVLLGAYSLFYASQLTFEWLPVQRTLAGDLLFIPFTAGATYLAWRASRRATDWQRLRHAWFLVALAFGAWVLGDIAQLVYEYLVKHPTYPSVSDAFYLIFYPLMLAGILSFPAIRRTRRQVVELTIDCAVVTLGGSAAFVYLVFGTDLIAGGSPVEVAVSVAYPVGDVIILVGLSTALLRSPLPSIRTMLRWLSAGVAVFVLADLIYSELVLHDAYHGGDPIDALYIVSFILFIVATMKAGEVRDNELVAPRVADTPVGWMPFLALGAAGLVLAIEERGASFFPHSAVLLVAVLAAALVLVRQAMLLSRLRRGNARLAQTQALAQIGSWAWNVKRDRIELPDEERRMYGFSPTEPISRKESIRVIHPDDREQLGQILRSSLSEAQPFITEIRVIRGDGKIRTMLVRGEVKTRAGQVVGMQGTQEDITDRKRMEGQLRYQADHDPLTGLFNRRRFSEELERAIRYSSRYERSGAVLMLDVDYFKFINDSHGHVAGDVTLKRVARAIAAQTRDTDTVARLGGDEFAVILPEASQDAALTVANDIRVTLAAGDNGSAVRLSVGIAPFNGSGERSADEVLIDADIALYEAKEAGKDQVNVFDGRPSAALTWVERIRRALAEDRFVLYGQPMIDLATGEVSHQELLIRMLSEHGDVIPPGSFLPTAERFGLINEIDRWVTGKGLELARDGQNVSINLSAASIGDEAILVLVRRAIADGVLPESLIFEVTETAAMTNMDGARAFAEELSDLGCSFALDDFGTGFGSFTYLKHMPSRYLKIDMEFIKDLVANATDREVVKSITDVAHSLGKRTIAEGVEDEATLEILRSYGVDGAQGFLLGKPEPVSPLAPSGEDPHGAEPRGDGEAPVVGMPEGRASSDDEGPVGAAA